MRIADFLALLVTSALGGGAFFTVGIKPIIAISCAIALLAMGLCMLNYLNHGKFRIYVARSPVAR
ncbi:hypothetical protein A2524_01975 [Candidatus Wolfebacteria bacterium RIFOXYD12_FULL_48_21]|nr:MAG: hypothetical protein A2524_01975 [Candidatus Wolfebacteria bacterium RIFOXYD12_FULL_48_21]